MTAVLFTTESDGISARIYKTSSQPVNDDSLTKVQIDAAHFDAFGFFDEPNYQFKVPTGMGGHYFFWARCYWDSHATVDKLRYVEWQYNGGINSRDSKGQPADGEPVGHTITGWEDLNDGDTLALYARQRSGTQLDLNEIVAGIWRVR
jgi:hypothetical protein